MSFLTRGVLALLMSAMSSIQLAAQTSGLLLGVERMPGTVDSASRSRYETLWIVRSEDRPLRTVLPDLIVPRSSGFWRAGIAATCADDDMMYRIDVLWFVKAAARPVIAAKCPTVPASDVTWIAGMREIEDRAVLDTLTVVCQVSHLEIMFASPEYVGTRESSRSTEECEPRGDRDNVTTDTRRWDEAESRSFLDIAGEGGRAALQRAIRAAVTDTSAGEECESFISRSEDDYVFMEQWYVTRERGRWQPAIFQKIYGAPCEQGAPVDWTLPASFTGHDALRPGWAAIAARVPGLEDAFTSPTGDMTVAITRDSLFVLESDGVSIGARLLAREFTGRRIVMAQWALGRNVARWNRELSRLKSGLRPALVRHPRRP